MGNYVVTYDVGTTVSRSSIYKIGDRIELVQSSSREYPLYTTPDGRNETEGGRLVGAICSETKPRT